MDGFAPWPPSCNTAAAALPTVLLLYVRNVMFLIVLSSVDQIVRSPVLLVLVLAPLLNTTDSILSCTFLLSHVRLPCSLFYFEKYLFIPNRLPTRASDNKFHTPSNTIRENVLQ